MLLKPPFLTPSAIVRTDRSSSFINLAEAYRGNPYDIRNLSPLRRRSEPPNSQVIQPPALEGLHCQAAGHPEDEMDYEEQPLDMSIKGKSVNYSSNGSSSSTSPSIDILVASPGSQAASTPSSQVNRPSVITCAPSLKIKNGNSSPVDFSSELDCSHSMVNRIVSSPGSSSIHYTNSISPKSNGHSQDTMIANETAKLNISKSVTLENPVDEHFRRSLGGLFSSGLFKSSSSSPSANRVASSSPNANSNSQMLKNTCMSSDSAPDESVKSSVTSIITEVCTDVDDHFAKALGADWLKLKKNETPDPGSQQ